MLIVSFPIVALFIARLLSFLLLRVLLFLILLHKDLPAKVAVRMFTKLFKVPFFRVLLHKDLPAKVTGKEVDSCLSHVQTGS